ncbi:MAG: sulfatase-like hydrolase/transferase, partial [bacterium]|nr:sulfatase-like hydrolase/transferase [bacterium]
GQQEDAGRTRFQPGTVEKGGRPDSLRACGHGRLDHPPHTDFRSATGLPAGRPERGRKGRFHAGIGSFGSANNVKRSESNTMVIFSSGNGAPGYNGLPDLNRPYRGWKLTCFEGGIHVPYFMRWPARIKPGSKLEASVHFIDMHPTVTGAVGAQMPTDRKIDGVNLLD